MTKQSDLRSKAGELRDDTQNPVRQKTENASAREFDANGIQAQVVDHVACQIEDIAGRLRKSDLGAVTREVSDIARRHPALFIGGAAVLGFAVTRVLKARDPEARGQPAQEADPWVAHACSGGVDVPS